MEQKYRIIKNGDTLCGFFEFMFEKNTISVNTRWGKNTQNFQNFDGVQYIQTSQKKQANSIVQKIGKTTSGSGGIVLTDSDGNSNLIDQYR